VRSRFTPLNAHSLVKNFAVNRKAELPLLACKVREAVFEPGKTQGEKGKRGV